MSVCVYIYALHGCVWRGPLWVCVSMCVSSVGLCKCVCVLRGYVCMCFLWVCVCSMGVCDCVCVPMCECLYLPMGVCFGRRPEAPFVM